MTNLWRSIILWLRDTLNQHVKTSKIDNVLGINNGDNHFHMVILAAKEVIKRKTGGPLSY